MIGWVVLTLSCRQTNFCLSMPQPSPWFKVTERPSSTFSQIYTFFVPNIKGLAQAVLTWDAKVIADVDGETNWKHIVTPDWGDLIVHWSFSKTLCCLKLSFFFQNGPTYRKWNAEVTLYLVKLSQARKSLSTGSRQVVNHWHHTPQRQLCAVNLTPLQIILSWKCSSNIIEVHGN